MHVAIYGHSSHDKYINLECYTAKRKEMKKQATAKAE